MLLPHRLMGDGLAQALAQDPGLQDQLDGGVPQFEILRNEAFQGVGRLAGSGLVPLENLETRHSYDPRKSVDPRPAPTRVGADLVLESGGSGSA